MVDPPEMLDLDFDQVLAVLQGWMGKPIVVGIDATHEPLSIATLRGVLGASHEIIAPYDEDEWEFTIGDYGRFAIQRAYFGGANYFPDGGRLIAGVLNDSDAPDDPPSLWIHVVGPPRQTTPTAA